MIQFYKDDYAEGLDRAFYLIQGLQKGEIKSDDIDASFWQSSFGWILRILLIIAGSIAIVKWFRAYGVLSKIRNWISKL